MRVRFAASVVEPGYVDQRFQRAIVHVRRGQLDIAQRRCFERADVSCLPCNVETTQLRETFPMGQHVRVKLATRAAGCFLLNAANQFFQVVVPGRDARVVKLVIGEERGWRCDFVAGDALGFALGDYLLDTRRGDCKISVPCSID